MSAESAIQKALYQSLSGIGLRVYDAAPQSIDGGNISEFPYTEIGTIVISPLDTKDVNGFDFVARIHTFDRSKGMKPVKEIQGQIYGQLHNGTINIDGYGLILLRRQFSAVMVLSDGSFDAVDEYQGLVEQTGD